MEPSLANSMRAQAMKDPTVTANTSAENLHQYIEKVLTFHGVYDLKTKAGIPLKDVVFGMLRETLVKDEKARGGGGKH